jgi:integrase
MRRPFTLYKEQTKSGLVWYVRFWNAEAQKYSQSRSTGVLIVGKQERKREAEDVAREMLASIKPTKSDANGDKLFPQYVADFWLPDSPYVRECATVKKKPLSAIYVKINHEDVRRHIEPFPGFKNIALKKLTAGMIRDWMKWAVDKGLSGRRTNTILSSMRVAVRDAVNREELDRDPFRKIGQAAESRKEKGVLTPAEVLTLMLTPASDPISRLAVLFELLCGMRRGEVRGLQWGDIGDGLINIQHNFVEDEPIKTPKSGSFRTVPFTTTVKDTIEAVRKLVSDTPQSFVFESLECPGQPMGESFFRNATRRELESIGIPGKWRKKRSPPEDYSNEQQRRNLTFHGLRHSFITLGRLAGITDMEIQALAGHKDGRMMNRYSHASQVLDFQALKEKMEKQYLPKEAGGNE